MTHKVSDHNGTRDATPDEAAAIDLAQADASAQAAAVEAQASARASALAKLAALGLTEAEVKALAG